jgi:hypothetical protein
MDVIQLSFTRMQATNITCSIKREIELDFTNRCSLRLQLILQGLAHKHQQGRQGNLDHVRTKKNEFTALQSV